MQVVITFIDDAATVHELPQFKGRNPHTITLKNVFTGNTVKLIAWFSGCGCIIDAHRRVSMCDQHYREQTIQFIPVSAIGNGYAVYSEAVLR